jgi:virginiamycin B lyase
LWLTEFQVDRTQLRGRIHRMATDGQVTEQFLAPDGVTPDRIVAGPDGALWFSDPGDKIGRITTTGEFTIHPVPNGFPMDITVGSDGALWFTERNNGIGRIGADGRITDFPVGGAFRITSGPDGALWFTRPVQASVGRITTDGQFAEYPVGCNGCRGGAERFDVSDIATGPDGALWITEDGSDYGPQRIARMTTDGALAGEFPITGKRPQGIVAGPDGTMWFTEAGRAEGDDGRISSITMAGEVREFQLPTSRSYPYGITAGPDRNLWLVEYLAAKVARSPTQPTAPPPTPVPAATIVGPWALAVAAGAALAAQMARERRGRPTRGSRHARLRPCRSPSAGTSNLDGSLATSSTASSRR